MGSSEFNTGDNPAMDWHLVHAIETEICSHGSLVEVIQLKLYHSSEISEPYKETILFCKTEHYIVTSWLKWFLSEPLEPPFSEP